MESKISLISDDLLLEIFQNLKGFYLTYYRPTCHRWNFLIKKYSHQLPKHVIDGQLSYYTQNGKMIFANQVVTPKNFFSRCLFQNFRIFVDGEKFEVLEKVAEICGGRVPVKFLEINFLQMDVEKIFRHGQGGEKLKKFEILDEYQPKIKKQKLEDTPIAFRKDFPSTNKIGQQESCRNNPFLLKNLVNFFDFYNSEVILAGKQILSYLLQQPLCIPTIKFCNFFIDLYKAMPNIDPNLTVEAHISSNELIFQIDNHSESYLSFLSTLYQTYEHAPNPISLPKSIKVVHKNLRTHDDRMCVYSSNEHICVTFSGGFSVRQEILENGMKEFYVKNNWRNEFRLNVMHTFVETESIVEIEKILF